MWATALPARENNKFVPSLSAEFLKAKPVFHEARSKLYIYHVGWGGSQTEQIASGHPLT